jgi:hypothetical protein
MTREENEDCRRRLEMVLTRKKGERGKRCQIENNNYRHNSQTNETSGVRHRQISLKYITLSRKGFTKYQFKPD